MANGYRNLIVWQKSTDLVTSIYTLTESFPKTELFGLTSQMRRSAVSIPSNIAEGSKRQSKADFRNFLAVALGSAAELETQLELANRLKFSDAKISSKTTNLLSEVSKMLTTLVVRSKD